MGNPGFRLQSRRNVPSKTLSWPVVTDAPRLRAHFMPRARAPSEFVKMPMSLNNGQQPQERPRNEE